MANEAKISFRLPGDVNEKLKKIAAEDRRSKNSLIVKILADYAEKKGA